MDVVIVLWVLALACVVLWRFSFLRFALITRPFLTWFRECLPALSKVEKQALRAGGLSWEKDFFLGKPNWNALFDAHHPELSSAETAFLENQVETFCALLNDWDIIETRDLPPAAWEYIKQEKLWGLVVSKQYGGLGFSAVAHSTIIKKISSRSLSAAITVMVPNSLGPAEFIERYGTVAQRDYYLPRLVKGEEIGCFALTATEAGSDATALTDTGIVCEGVYRGKSVIGIRLTWEKRYITLAPIATLIGLAFKLYDPNHLLGDETDVGITIALIPSDLPGVVLGDRHRPLNLGFMNGTIHGQDVFIPLEYIVGGVEQRGQGWQMMMECLAIGRGISLPSLATAATQASFRMTSAYAAIREQFHRAIGDFEGVGQALAEIGGFSYLSEAVRLLTAHSVDQGVNPAVASAIAKYHLTEMSRRALNHAMDIHAGHAIQMGPRNLLASFYQGIPIAITVEGANVLTRNLIIYGQGVMRCHPYLYEEILAAEDRESVVDFDRLLWKHVRLIGLHTLRAVTYIFTGARFVSVPRCGHVSPYLKQLTRMSNAFALVSDVSLATLGSTMKLKESLSSRLADILSHLYLATAAIKYFVERDQPEEEWIFLEWSLCHCLSEIQEAFFSLWANFPNRFLARVMRWLVFPWGRPYAKPSDALALKMADAMQNNLRLREVLTQHCYVAQYPQDPASSVERAFQQLKAMQALIQKLKKSGKTVMMNKQLGWSLDIEAAFESGVLSEAERDQLKTLDALCCEALRVDEFTKEGTWTH